MRNLYIFGLILTFCAIPAAVLEAARVKTYSAGSFVDSSNAAHQWTISEHHTLTWDGNPYLPAGGVFYSRYISEARTEANWEEDVKSLELLKSKGITDLLLKNVGPASWVPAEAWQRLIDYLDTNDFTYGLDLSDNPKGVLTGYIIRPHRYRLPGVVTDKNYTFTIPDAVSAFYVLARSNDASVVRSGTVQAVDGKISIQVKATPGIEYVLLLYPEVDISGHGDGGIPNIWDGYDAFRDRLLAFLSKIKFGKGFRFFLDPFDVRMSLVGNLATAVPNSPAFRLEFEAWLSKKYPLSSNVASAWGLVAQEVPTVEATTRLIPLWHAGKGVSEAYDIETGELRRMTVQSSSMWEDIIDFRDSSIRAYMNAIADALKKQVADVPVVFRMGDYHRVYVNNQPKGGFDGLAVDTYGTGEALVGERLGPAYSLTSESAKTMWTIVSSYSDVKPGNKQTPGFSSQTQFMADMDLLREGGAKGMFVLAMQMSPKVISKNHELIHLPEQLDWLAEFKKRMSGSSQFAPRVVYFPSSTVSGAVAKRLSNGAWWLPSLRPAKTFSMADEVLGYSFTDEGVSYLWSISGDTTATLKLQKGQQPLIVYPNPPDDRAVIDKGQLVLKLDDGPLGIRGIGQNQLFPIEIAQEEISKLESLLKPAEAAGSPVVGAKDTLANAKKVLKSGSAYVAYDMAHTAVMKLLGYLTSYAWLEGESTLAQNFDRILPATGASFGRYLYLDSANDPPMMPYNATYTFTVPKDGTYNLWLSGYIPGDTGSPIAYSIDGREQVEVTEAKPVGAPYGPGFSWMKIGEVSLSKGEHTLTLTVTGRRKSDNRYVMAVDAILVTNDSFVPSGTKKP